jgi:ribonuclease P protein component
VHHRHRLSRSRDFDTVYRQGASVSTRYLTLHWFRREEDADGEPRLGLAVPRAVGPAVARNRVKRVLREAWKDLLAEIPPGRDYVLVARPGLAEPASSRGHDWLRREISEALAKVPG